MTRTAQAAARPVPRRTPVPDVQAVPSSGGGAAATIGQRDPLWMKLGAVAFYGFCALVIYVGWRVRDHNYLSAEFGAGYLLGIVGTTLMVLLLLYPARKRVRAFARLGPIRYWFRVHMLFGVIGPILILFHCNFRLGSFNSRTVLFAMLTVSISGFFGRYFYSRIHHGLYGRKANLEELQRSFQETRDKESTFAQIAPTIIEELSRVERPLLSPAGKLHASMFDAFLTGFTTRWAYLKVRVRLGRALKRAALTSPIVARERIRLERNCLKYVARRLKQLRGFAQFVMFERLFSIWHVVHYPMFLVLVVAVIVHIVAVHMY